MDYLAPCQTLPAVRKIICGNTAVASTNGEQTMTWYKDFEWHCRLNIAEWGQWKTGTGGGGGGGGTLWSASDVNDDCREIQYFCW